MNRIYGFTVRMLVKHTADGSEHMMHRFAQVFFSMGCDEDQLVIAYPVKLWVMIVLADCMLHLSVAQTNGFLFPNRCGRNTRNDHASVNTLQTFALSFFFVMRLKNHSTLLFLLCFLLPLLPISATSVWFSYSSFICSSLSPHMPVSHLGTRSL